MAIDQLHGGQLQGSSMHGARMRTEPAPLDPNDGTTIEPTRYDHGVVGWAERVLDAGSVVIILAMVGVTCVDVIGRYLFHAPLQGAYELNEILLPMLVFLSLPGITWRDGHVKVSLIDSLLGRRAKAVRDCAFNLLSAAALAVLTWHLILLAGRKAAIGETAASLGVELAPVAYLVAGTVALSALCLVLRCFRTPEDASC